MAEYRKIPHVGKFSACNSGAGNGRANFMGAWDFLLLENPHAHKFLLLGGGVPGFLEGGVEVPILFLWARGFF